MTSIRRPDGGDHTAPEDTATKWPPCVGMGGRDASESVAAIIGMRTLPGVATWTTSAGFLRGVNNGVDGMTDFQADELALLMTGDRQYLLEPGHRMPALTTTGRTAPCRKATTGR